MEKIKRFLECLLPVTVCNLKCSYCYIIQENRRSMKLADMKYSPEHIAKALRKERLGGTALISICGAGETLTQPEVVDIVKYILKEGHFVNITTNGTLSNKFDAIITECKDYISRLHIAFSFHYLELKRKDLIEIFFNNVLKMKNAGASILVQINMCDEYIPHINDIKNICFEKIGAYPQAALTRDEEASPMKIHTKYSENEYLTQGAKFNSSLFDFTVKNFMKKRTEFCYAGDWSGTLDLQSGILKKCYDFPGGVNIFEDINSPIHFEAIGSRCHSPYCINSSHFMSLGVIPGIKTPSYAQLRNREEASWYTEEMKNFLNGKLSDSNKKYNAVRRCKINNNGKFSIKGFLSEFEFYQKLHEIKVKNCEK